MLEGQGIVLRAWGEEDLPGLALLRNDLELQSMLVTQPRPNSMERVRRWLVDKGGREDVLLFVIADRASQQALGYVQLANMQVLHGTAELGICLAPEAQGKGGGREVLELLVHYARQVFNLRKITLQVLADNRRAIAFYLRIGFVEAGCLRDQVYIEGRYRDVLIMEKRLIP
ncbi:MAG: GNAT family N-acetyltransferase [Gammaproteobacteria bacterium]|nr:GNAT family N-acetyltransferase [Gammaproteobacteria bacterium]MBU0884928.1 GNAT family N-acetyltransferase [Gammaproteobacteria bacterium]MBU1859548.1 GNAT family N-acetyltransferase [Gammaproteobacteria bacterium]